jgi:hypothetical protein
VDDNNSEKKKRGRKPLPEGLKRQRRAVRLSPATLEFLEQIMPDNIGRSIDVVVAFLRDDAKVRAVDLVH